MIHRQDISTALFALRKTEIFTLTILLRVLTTQLCIWNIIRQPAIYALQGK